MIRMIRHPAKSRIAATLIALTFLSIWAAEYAAASDPRDNSRIVSILRHDGFSSSTDGGMSLQYVGTIRTARNYFWIYFYNHTNIHPAQIAHGIQKLVMIKDGRRYAGSYLLSGDDPIPAVSGLDVIFALPSAAGNKIHFDEDGAPRHARINGDYSDLGH
jgi:hypothetical protein